MDGKSLEILLGNVLDELAKIKVKIEEGKSLGLEVKELESDLWITYNNFQEQIENFSKKEFIVNLNSQDSRELQNARKEISLQNETIRKQRNGIFAVTTFAAFILFFIYARNRRKKLQDANKLRIVETKQLEHQKIGRDLHDS